MGKIDQPWLEAGKLQANTLLQLEAAQASAGSWIDTLSQLTEANVQAAKSGLGVIAQMQFDPQTTLPLPQLDYGSLAESQARYARTVFALGTAHSRQIANLNRAYWDEVQRQFGASFKV